MYNIFGELLSDSGIKAYQVSKDTGIATSTLSEWKKGRSTPKLDKITQIADYFKVPTDLLLERGPFEHWEVINANRLRFMKAYLAASRTDPRAIQLIYFDPYFPDSAKVKDFANFIRDNIEAVELTSDLDFKIMPKKSAQQKTPTPEGMSADLAELIRLFEPASPEIKSFVIAALEAEMQKKQGQGGK